MTTARTEQATHENVEVIPTEETQEVARPKQQRHIGFAPDVEDNSTVEDRHEEGNPPQASVTVAQRDETPTGASTPAVNSPSKLESPVDPSRPHIERTLSSRSIASAISAYRTPGHGSPAPGTHNFHSDVHGDPSRIDYFHDAEAPRALSSDADSEKMSFSNLAAATMGQVYTHKLREAPRQSFKSQLKIHHGRINQDKWWKAAVRPFVLYSYPAVLWSSAVYACSVGWLIVISECVAVIYREGYYEFGALSTGLVYISPFVGGVLGTAVAGKVSDVVVQALARRNGGLYEPEFRLVMAIPIVITTVLGLIGFGWSANAEEPWIVPTVFFGIVSFGCSLGSTTAITFCVDSYRQYAGEALVTLNFSKNILHGLVFSFFVTGWLKTDGSKTVFVWIGIIQLIVLLSTIPMYIYGKRARMWTVRMNFMEKL